MDSPSEALNQQPSQMFPFRLYSGAAGAAPSAHRYTGTHPPSYPTMSHLLHSCSSQHLSSHTQRHVMTECMEESGPNRDDRDREEDMGSQAAPSLPQLLSRGKSVPSSEAGDWSKELGSRNIVCVEGSFGRAGEKGVTDGEGQKGRRSEVRPKRGGREGRLRQRQELKILLRETRGRLLELQQRVWRAYGDRRGGMRAGRSDTARDRAPERLGFSDDEEASEHGAAPLSPQWQTCGDSSEKRSSNPKEGGPSAQRADLGERRLWPGCGPAGGQWEAGSDGGPKFAQALKHELGSAVARVIDRVTSLYAQNGPSTVADTTSVERGNSKQEDISRVNNAASSLGQTEALPLVLKRPQEKVGHNPNPSQNLLLPQLNSSLPSLPHSHVPALLSTPSKEPFLTSFPPAPPPLPLPLLHYTMQHLFARSLSNMPVHKDCLSADTFLDFSPHTSSFPPLPLLGQVDPPLPTSDREGGGRGPAGGLVAGYTDVGDTSHYLPGGSSQEGLSPCHLKKAKLMFFYTRYPSSNTLKTYFPDVKFNRCVTSQLIKWFSNFREFFYIQMERFARQAAREGVAGRGQGPLHLGRDSELYRILNLHYNKSNDYQVPDRFLEVSELALREFFSAIQAGRDTDPCWKKSIYKIICKLDSPVPDSFRLPGCPVGMSSPT